MLPKIDRFFYIVNNKTLYKFFDKIFGPVKDTLNAGIPYTREPHFIGYIVYGEIIFRMLWNEGDEMKIGMKAIAWIVIRD